MIRPEFFMERLKAVGVEFFAGVPDSLLKNICAYMTDNLDESHHVIAANEGGAVGLAAGYHLATGKPGCVYMQNSGEGNAVNPLASLMDKDVYGMPLLLIIGWRGRPGVHDEPQHVKQGKITTGLLNTLGINYDVLAKEESVAERQIENAAKALRNNEVYALVVEKDTFDSYSLKNTRPERCVMSREEAIRAVAASMPADAVVVGTTGMISRELFEYRTAMSQSHERDFLTVGSMGHASMIALGIAMQQPGRKVYCFDGDGAAIMHMGNMAIVGSKAPRNFVHVVFNNGAHDSVGGQPTVGHYIDMVGIAKAMHYAHVSTVSNPEELRKCLDAMPSDGPVMLEVRVKRGNRKDLGRPTTTPEQNKEALMTFLKK